MLSATDHFTTRVFSIACLPGDGIGPEVMEEAVKVLKKIEQLSHEQCLADHDYLSQNEGSSIATSPTDDGCPIATSTTTLKTTDTGNNAKSSILTDPLGNTEGSTNSVTVSSCGSTCLTSTPRRKKVRFDIIYGKIGGAAYDDFGTHCPDETLQLIDKADAILFGSIGGPVEQQDDPKWHDCEKNSLLVLRQHLQLGVNLRPTVVFPSMKELSPLKNERLGKGVDLLIVRELLGCVYAGPHVTDGDTATDLMRYTRSQIVQALDFAFRVARLQPHEDRRKVTVIDKANVLDCSRLWRKTAKEVHEEYSDVKLEFMYVDAAALHLLLHPTQFSVICTGNLFGDILSDLVSGLPGSLGLMPSVSFGPTIHLYEPAGGSAPDLAGQNIANPIAQILSVAMMLRYSFGMDTEATSIQKAVEEVLTDGLRTLDLALPGDPVVSTSEMGDAITRKVEEILAGPANVPHEVI